MFGAISICLYTSAYTPLKTKTPLSVFVGAIPGAIPFMLGWVAATGKFGIEAGVYLCFSFFGNFHTFGPSDGFYMKTIKKQASICCQQENATKALHFKPLFIPFGRFLFQLYLCLVLQETSAICSCHDFNSCRGLWFYTTDLDCLKIKQIKPHAN